MILCDPIGINIQESDQGPLLRQVSCSCEHSSKDVNWSNLKFALHFCVLGFLEFVYDFHSNFLEGSLRPSSSGVLVGRNGCEVSDWDAPRPSENIRFNINGLVSHIGRVTTLSTHPPPRKKSLSQLNWRCFSSRQYQYPVLGEKNLVVHGEPHLQVRAALCGVILLTLCPVCRFRLFNVISRDIQGTAFEAP